MAGAAARLRPRSRRAERPTRPRRLVVGVALALLVLSGACSGGAGGESPAPTVVGPTSTTHAGRDDDAPPTTDPAIRIVLGAGRLTVGGNALVFDAPASQVSSYLERALGDPVEESEEDCGPGRLRVVEWPGLQVFLLDGRLTGWLVDDETFATSTGVAIGSTRGELLAAHPSATFPESSLGEEFFVEGTDADPAGLSGVLSGDEVSALWSGATCIAR